MMHHSEVRARELLGRLNGADPVGVEVGVYRGEMSAQLLRLRPDLTLYMVDDWLPVDARPARYRNTRDPRARDSAAHQARNVRMAERVARSAPGRARIVRGDSVKAAQVFEYATFDFTFIDAEHTYEAVQADIRAWLPKLKAGGLLCGHDYAPPGKYSTRGWPGVVQAVDEAVEEHGWTLDLGEQATWFVRP